MRSGSNNRATISYEDGHRWPRHGSRAAAGFAVAVLACPIGVDADPVTIANPGFEVRKDEFADGQHKYLQPALDTWRHFEVDNNGGPTRIWNPGLPGSSNPGFGGDAPEGSMVIRVYTRYNDDEFHVPPKPRDFEAAAQLLTETFNPATNYILRAHVGRAQGLLWNGYRVQLAVGGAEVNTGGLYSSRVEGGTVIAEDTNSMFIAENTFATSIVYYAASDTYTNLAGLRMQIRLCAMEDPLNHATTSYAIYDDVSLETSDRPPPSPPPPTGVIVLLR